MEKDRKVEKFHAELIIRQQKCGKVDLKGLSASQAEFLRREIWRKIEKQEIKNKERPTYIGKNDRQILNIMCISRVHQR